MFPRDVGLRRSGKPELAARAEIFTGEIESFVSIPPVGALTDEGSTKVYGDSIDCEGFTKAYGDSIDCEGVAEPETEMSKGEV
jgi:hypothetical protein